MKRLIYLTLIITGSLFVFTNCNKDEDEAPPMGWVEGIVSAASGGELEGAQIDIYLDNGDPAGITTKTDASGYYKVELKPGTYTAIVNLQGYESSPPRGVIPIGFPVADNETKKKDYVLNASTVENSGWITGTVKSGSAGIGGVAVLATTNVKGEYYMGVSNSEGGFTIYNVPAESYSVKGWKQSYNSEATSASVSANAEISVSITISDGASGSLWGTVSSIGKTDYKGPVDVTLIDKETGVAIPGLSVMSNEHFDYEITGVPNGLYIARATFKNDKRVVDPDWIFKFGEPIVTINNARVEQAFSMTGAVLLTNPTNSEDDVTPIEETSLTPTFTWSPYSSITDYAFELSTENGEIIWGGISGDYGSLVKEVLITSETYTMPTGGTIVGTKTAPALEVGRVYRWRIYASKNDTNATEGWKLISMSEDQMGLIKIVAP